MKKKILMITLTLGLAVGMIGLTGCGGSSSSSSDEETAEGITVGGLWALTGFMDSYETAGSAGFELALEEINDAGGIDGQQVNYVSYDSESEVDKSTELIAKLIESDGADVVVGMGDPNAAIAAGTVAQEKGVPTLATSSTLPYTQDRVGDTAFLVPYGDNVQAAAVAEYAYNELGLKSAYVLTDTTDEYTLALSKYFKSHFEALGGEILGETEYDDNGYTDYSPAIQKINSLSEKPDAVFLGSFTDQGPTILKQLRDAGIDATALSGDGLDDASVAEIAGDAANNTYFSTHANLTADNAQDFLAAYNEKYGSDPQNAFAALGYDAAYLLKYAVENYANGDYSAGSIRDAIAQVTDFEGLTGTIDYSSGNVPNKTVFINQFKDGKDVYVTQLVPEIGEDE